MYSSGGSRNPGDSQRHGGEGATGQKHRCWTALSLAGGFPSCSPLPALWLTACVCVCASFQQISESNLKVRFYFAAV